MRALLVLAAITIILFILIILKLLSEIRILNKKTKYVDEADMWHELAFTDDLTGLYNRNAYNLHIDREQKELSGIILFDVDNFKMINDTKGHSEGDRVLKNTAKILLKIFSEPQYKVFRIGGDEFSVLAQGVCENEIIERLIAMRECLGEIGLSKGYSVVKDNPEEAFEYADEMLYADKLTKNLRGRSAKRGK